MAHVVADRVRETTSTTGTGAFTLTGAATGCRTFASVLPTNGDTCWYSAQAGSQWEIGLGTRASSTSLTRTTVYSNSNGDTSAVNFSTAPDVFITVPADILQAVAKDLGNSDTSTQTLNVRAAASYKITATGAFTLATSGWVPGVLQAVLLKAVNFGSQTVTLPTINWVKPDGTTTTSFSSYLTALAVSGRTTWQSSGTDLPLFWSDDGGTTIYGKLI